MYFAYIYLFFYCKGLTVNILVVNTHTAFDIIVEPQETKKCSSVDFNVPPLQQSKH